MLTGEATRSERKLSNIVTALIGWTRESHQLSQQYIYAVSLLIKKCYFTVGNNILIQEIGIPKGLDPAPFLANLFLYHFEAKYITSLVSARSKIQYNFHSIGRFIDDLCVIKDRNSFFDNCKDIYPKELEIKLEHQGSHATFLDLDIDILISDYIINIFSDFPSKRPPWY